jgi:hypothetical protein
MKRRHKIALVLLIALVSMVVVVNLPIINTGVIVSGCSSFSDCTSPHPLYESIAQEYCLYVCMYACCINVITLGFVTLYAGTASNTSSRGTAHLVVEFNNPASSTKLSSYSFWSPGNSSITFYQCSTSVSCVAISKLTLSGNSVTKFDNATNELYLSSDIISNETCNYVFNFANGQSVSGTVAAN